MSQCLFVIGATLISLVGCAVQTQSTAGQQENTFGVQENIGWTDAACLAIKNATLVPAQTVWWLETNQLRPARRLQVVAQSADPDVCAALSPGRAEVNQGAGYSFYALSANAAELDFGIAFLEQAASAQYEATSCVTSEGVAFEAKTHNRSEEPWSGYYYLGYDVESTCPE
ncbi:hypothetical protein E8K88_13085 [Lampropedia aestuarii]|uniref:Lipoprotein n=1 Tax=Lampropedia aestuarii TaxID=2562762 RepID=A0A4S5BR46_9BURK|nr:hypothetical protein [Lampropedia aestuarii]THJ32176.1 hypothetical protein E8K88_13085 [Lampropedia aestuarii]